VTAAPLHPRLEYLPAPRLRELQNQKLRALIRRAGAFDGYYKRLLRGAGIDTDVFGGLDELERVPYSTKESLIRDQQEHPPLGSRLLVEEAELARLSMSGGSSGRGREYVAHTRQDLLVLGGLEGTAFRWGGVEEGDVFVFHAPLVNATASLAFPYGVEAVARIKYLVGYAGFAERLELMATHGVAGMWGTPSTINGLGAECVARGIDPRTAFPTMKAIVVAGENYPLAWVSRIEDLWGARLIEGYGSTQTHGGLCMSTCEAGAARGDERGVLHTYDWSFVMEVRDPDTDEPVAPGESGELVVTTLDKRAAPAIRYRTGDRVRLLDEVCPCGRETMLLEAGTIGRYDDMVKVKGCNIWPDQVDDLLLRLESVVEYQANIVISDRGRDEIELRFATSAPESADALGRAIASSFKRAFGVTPRVVHVERDTLDIRYADGGKARRWNDLRQEALGG
jgi:phenylacetate-CoA ligase